MLSLPFADALVPCLNVTPRAAAINRVPLLAFNGLRLISAKNSVASLCAHGELFGVSKFSRFAEIVTAKRPKSFMYPLWDQDVHRLSDQVFAEVSEQLRGSHVDLNNHSLPIQQDECLGRKTLGLCPCVARDQLY